MKVQLDKFLSNTWSVSGELISSIAVKIGIGAETTSNDLIILATRCSCQASPFVLYALSHSL